MKETVSSQNSEGLRRSDIIVQYSPQLQSVGLGFEPQKDDPVPGSYHFLDAIYGDVPIQTQIGRLFVQKMSELGFKWESPVHRDSDEENEWYNRVGRAILDSVTASSKETSLWGWFDRPGINRLIRLLRKARDSAFGRDE